MTLTAPPASQLWSSMPGWGITANLLPPEIIAARRLRVVRKMIVGVLIAVVVLGGAGYAYAFFQQRTAQSQLSAEKSKTAELVQQQQKYAEVVQLAGTIAHIKGQLATLMAGDVDTSKLVDETVAALPPGGSITQLQVALTNGPATSASTSSSTITAAGGGVLDLSGQVHIGSMSVVGTARSMTDIAGYVNALSLLPGVVEVYPASQGTGTTPNAIQFTIEVTLTDKLLTHRYDVVSATAPTGGK